MLFLFNLSLFIYLFIYLFTLLFFFEYVVYCIFAVVVKNVFCMFPSPNQTHQTPPSQKKQKKTKKTKNKKTNHKNSKQHTPSSPWEHCPPPLPTDPSTHPHCLHLRNFSCVAFLFACPCHHHHHQHLPQCLLCGWGREGKRERVGVRARLGQWKKRRD